jgi:hypothetical protein
MLLPLWVAQLSQSGIDNTVNFNVPYKNAQIVARAGNNESHQWKENALNKYCMSFWGIILSTANTVMGVCVSRVRN